MKKVKKLLASFLACTVACAMSVTAFEATPLETRTEEAKNYLSAMNKKDGGLDEWGLIGLAASGISGDSDTVQSIIATALDDIYASGFDKSSFGESGWGSNAGALAKLILFLNSQEISPYTFGTNGDFYGYNLVATLFNTDYYYKNISAYDVPFALMVYDALGISAEEEATYKYSRKDLVEKCLSLIGSVNAASSGIPGGTSDMTGVANFYDITGKAPYDFEATAMVLQALAPYYTGSKTISDPSVMTEVTDKVDGCINSITLLQTQTGGIPYAFFTYDTDWNANFAKYADSADAMAQILIAFSALGINSDTIANGGNSMMENFLSDEYKTAIAGEFRANSDPLTEYYSTYYTTKYAYIALISFEGMMTDDLAPFSIFNRETPISYRNYSYSFYYSPSGSGSGNTTNSGNEKPDVTSPANTGDAFPFAGIILIMAVCGVLLIQLKKLKADR